MPRIKQRPTKKYEIPDDPDRGWVKIVYLNKTEIQDIVSRNVDARIINNPAGMETVTRVDQGEIRAAVAVAAIDSWGNFFDPSGSEMACTPANIRRWAKDEEFMAFLSDCREALAGEVEAREKAEIKNS